MLCCCRAVFFWGCFYDGEEVSVEASQGLEAAFFRYTQNGFIGISKQIAGLIYAVAVHVFREGYAGFFLEISREIDVVISCAFRKSTQVALGGITVFNKGENALQKLVIPRVAFGIFCGGIKLSAEGIQQSFYRTDVGLIAQSDQFIKVKIVYFYKIVFRELGGTLLGVGADGVGGEDA